MGLIIPKSLIERARKFARPLGKPATLYVGDLTDKSLHLPQTDIISCVSSLQYVPEEAGLFRFSTLLDCAKMGVLIAENPCKKLMKSGSKFRDDNLGYDAGDDYAHTYYSVFDFNQIAIKRGFKPRKIQAKLGMQSSYRWSMYYEKVVLSSAK